MKLSRRRYAARALSLGLILAALAGGYCLGRHFPDEVVDWARR